MKGEGYVHDGDVTRGRPGKGELFGHYIDSRREYAPTSPVQSQGLTEDHKTKTYFFPL